MTILIDNRKGSAELQPYISAPTKLTHLEFADFSFVGNGPDSPVTIGIERKAIRDLVSSIISGRLSGHQIVGLVNSYNYIYLVIDGSFKVSKEGFIQVPVGRHKWVAISFNSKTIPKSMIDNYLNNLLFTCNIHHEFTYSAKQTGAWITSIYNWWQKDWDKHTAHLSFYAPPPDRAMFRKPSLVHRMIKEIDKVGWNKGLEVSKNFSCMADVVLADPKDLAKIKGIGKVLAKRINNSLWGVK